MSGYDETVPVSLQKMQQWFSSIIIRRVDRDSKMNPISPSGTPLDIEAARYIVPSPTMSPAERIELYNCQYWWRILSVLQENFPLLTRLLGFFDFNEKIAEPYIEKYPSQHWSLNRLGDRFPGWIKEEYKGADADLLFEAAQVDLAYNQIFFEGELPLQEILSGADEEMMSSLIFFLQPHLRLFIFDHDMCSLREQLLAESTEYWEEHGVPLPEKEKKYFFVIYRDRNYSILSSEIDYTRYTILSFFERGCSVEGICELLENADEEIQQNAAANLHIWFQEWIARGWLGVK